ncbi:MAG: type IV pilus modification PilV family protein [Gemmatimonadota bacterium]
MPSVHRNGFTLIEILVALLLFTTGCLALLSTQTVVTARRSAALNDFALASLTLRVLDSLRSSDCSLTSAGSTTAPAGQVTWTAVRRPQAIDLSLTVTPARLGAPPWNTSTIVPCSP